MFIFCSCARRRKSFEQLELCSGLFHINIACVALDCRLAVEEKEIFHPDNTASYAGYLVHKIACRRFYFIVSRGKETSIDTQVVTVGPMREADYKLAHDLLHRILTGEIWTSK